MKEFDHILQCGHEKLEEFDKKGHELLDSISNKADKTFESIIKSVTQSNKRIEEKSDKAWNFLKWFAVITLGSGLALSGANTLILQGKANEADMENYYMTKENAKKVYKMQQYKIEQMLDGTAPFDTTNYNWLIESLFDEKSRGSYINER